MSRNLLETTCVHCGHAVELREAPRPITRTDCGAYFDRFEGMLVDADLAPTPGPRSA